jgi:peptidoglycan/xylan/chitin deacetylase (PgdA/CDA1 family)
VVTHELKPNRLPLSQDEIAKPRLTYHEVTHTRPSYRYGIATNSFKEHLVSLQQLTGRRLGSSEPCVTFDDGHTSQFVNAVPILEQFGEQAIFFITVGWTSKRAGYMCWNHLRELLARGYEVQSHGWSHALLTQCSLPELERELMRSKNELQDRLGAEVNAISVPGGRWNPQVLGACAAAGYARVFTSDPGTSAFLRDGVRVIGRWMVSRKMNAEDITALLHGKGIIVQCLRARHGLTEFAKSLIGDRAYQALWRTISSKNQSMENTQQAYDSAQESRP